MSRWDVARTYEFPEARARRGLAAICGMGFWMGFSGLHTYSIQARVQS